jgi:hypothetical protein
MTTGSCVTAPGRATFTNICTHPGALSAVESPPLMPAVGHAPTQVSLSEPVHAISQLSRRLYRTLGLRINGSSYSGAAENVALRRANYMT